MIESYFFAEDITFFFQISLKLFNFRLFKLSDKMKIFVNDKEMLVHNGAKVLDVIRTYYACFDKVLPSRLPIITDAYGNSLAHDGELSEGNHLYIQTQTIE